MADRIRAIDLFAGAGGFSTGARMAGCVVVWAANHWREAVEVHANNHPDTVHACQDLQQADWTRVPAHDLLLASPACQGHSRARGKERPHHDAQRATAWAVVSAAECHRTPVVVVENVPEFARWTLFPAWADAMRRLGYAISLNVVDAADCGVPQHRRRLFVIATRSKTPFALRLRKHDHVGAVSFVDFGAGRWSSVNRPGRSRATLARIAEGRRVHGARFLTAYYGNERGGRSLARPVGTITTRDRWAVVDGARMRMLTVDESRRAMGFPDDYRLPARQKDAMKMLGNAVCPPVARDIIQSVGAVSGYRLNPNKPVPLALRPKSKPGPAAAAGSTPGPRKVQIRPYVPAQPEIVVLGDARGVSIQTLLHGPNGERVAKQVIDLEPDDLQALIRGLATFVETPA